eukprot:COSAG02_NODE_4750_length_5026_cov_2.873960_2_plen_70_part_00
MAGGLSTELCRDLPRDIAYFVLALVAIGGPLLFTFALLFVPHILGSEWKTGECETTVEFQNKFTYYRWY